jgi:hypothetical protein
VSETGHISTEGVDLHKSTLSKNMDQTGFDKLFIDRINACGYTIVNVAGDGV